MDSILTSIKKLLGPEEDDTSFDTDIIMHINTVFTFLNDLGVGPSSGFSISDKTTTWDDYFHYFPEGIKKSEAVKTYMYLKVKLIFDPPPSQALIDAMTRNKDEIEWRLNVNAESGGTQNGG